MNNDMVRHWLVGAGRSPLLTADQEIELSRCVRAWLDFPGGPDKAPKSIQRAGRRSREKMINCNLRLVAKVAKKYGRKVDACSMDYCDLLQEGTIGLARAADKFEPEKGYKFSTYAYWWVMQSCQKALQASGKVIRVASGAQQLADRWRWRKEDESIEVFAKNNKMSIERCMETLACALQADRVFSTDWTLKRNDSDSATYEEVLTDNKDCPLHQIDLQTAIDDLNDAYPVEMQAMKLRIARAKTDEFMGLFQTDSKAVAQRMTKESIVRLRGAATGLSARLLVNS